MKRILCAIIACCIILGLCACGKGSPSWQEQYDLGMRYLSEGNYEEAIIAFTAAIEIDPKQPQIYVGRAEAYIGSGETAETLASALSDYEKAIELDDSNADAWLGLADVYIRQGDFDKALEVLKEALEIIPNDERIAEKFSEVESGDVTDSRGNIRKMSTYDGDGVLMYYHTYTYDSEDRESSVTSFNKNGVQTGHVEIICNANGDWTQSYSWNNDTGEVERYTMEYDDAGNVIREAFFDSKGALESYILVEYDLNNRRIKANYYEPDGTSWGYDTYEYEENAETRYSFDSNGELIGYDQWIYNEFGRNEYLSYDADGLLEWRRVNEYDSEGNLIGETEYDRDGNIIFQMRYE